MIEINRNPSTTVLRQFAALWLPLFGLLAGLSAWRGGHSAAAAVIWSAATVLAVVSLFNRRAARVIFVALSTLALPIGFVVSWMALAVVFFLVLTPLGLLGRRLGRNALQLERDPSATTFWHARSERPDVARALRQF